MPPPTIVARVRQVLGRALRETGQALDRAGIWGVTHATTTKTLGDPAYLYDDHLSRHRSPMSLLRRGTPQISDGAAFIAPCSTLIGTVRIGPGSSVWYGAVLRADRCNNGLGRSEGEEEVWRAMSKEKRSSPLQDWDLTAAGGGIYIGEGTNVQDGCVITAVEDHAVVGDGVTIGHAAHIHSATVESHSLIGMGAVLKPGSRVESLSFVAAGAVVDRDVTIPSGELWVGNPARKLRDLTEQEKERLYYQADEYVKVAKGQSHVMELGGNVPDQIFEQVQLGSGQAANEPLKVEELEPVKATGAMMEEEKAFRDFREMPRDDGAYSGDEEEEHLKARAQ